MYADIQGHGRDIVLIHGLGATHFSWRDTVATLKSNYRTHAVDLLGFGATPLPPGFDYSMSQQADAVIDYLKTSGVTEVILIGHSMGGGIGLFIADKLRNVTGPVIVKLVLIAPVAYPPSPGAFGTNLLTEPDPAKRARKLLEAAYHNDCLITPLQVAAYATNLTGARAETFLAHALKLGEIAAIEHDYRHINAEAKVIWGKDDSVLDPTNAATLASALGNATHEMIDSCGHVPQEESPVQTNALISNFL